MRQRFCRLCGRWHALEAWPAKCVDLRNPTTGLAAPGIISDAMVPVQSQLDGQIYDSKSRLRHTYRDAGVVELGNDSSVTDPQPRSYKIDRQAVRQSVAKAFSQAGL